MSYPNEDQNPPPEQDEKLDDASNLSLASAYTEGSGGISSRSQRIKAYRPPPRQQRDLLHKPPAQDTEMMGMLLHQNLVIEKYPTWNFLAGAFTWLLLAGVIVLPGTYPQFQKTAAEAAEKDPNLKNKIVSTTANIPLLYVAAALVSVGALGILWLWFKWRANYIWLINKVILPALMNSAMGLLTTLVNVLSAEEKKFNPIALATTCVTGASTVVMSGMFLYYNFYLLAAVRADHEKVRGDQSAEEAIAGGRKPPEEV